MIEWVDEFGGKLLLTNSGYQFVRKEIGNQGKMSVILHENEIKFVVAKNSFPSEKVFSVQKKQRLN